MRGLLSFTTHGYRTIGDIMNSLNPFTGSFYKEALQMSHLTREMFCLMEGRHVHPSTLYPGGVGTVATVQLFTDCITRLMKYVEFMKKTVPFHDDLFDFFYEALPGVEGSPCGSNGHMDRVQGARQRDRVRIPRSGTRGVVAPRRHSRWQDREPTPWNASPRDSFGTPGPYEDSVQDTPIFEEADVRRTGEAVSAQKSPHCCLLFARFRRREK